MSYNVIFTDELYHHGIKGQKWGIRRFRNDDGSLTAAGKARYDLKEAKRTYKKARLTEGKNAGIFGIGAIGKNRYKRYKQSVKDTDDALTNVYNKKADYTDLKSEKKTKKMYAKAYRKANIRASRSIHNSMVQKKGEKYANKIENTELAKSAAKFVAAVGVTAYAVHKANKILDWIGQYDASLPRLEGRMKVIN